MPICLNNKDLNRDYNPDKVVIFDSVHDTNLIGLHWQGQIYYFDKFEADNLNVKDNYKELIKTIKNKLIEDDIFDYVYSRNLPIMASRNRIIQDKYITNDWLFLDLD